MWLSQQSLEVNLAIPPEGWKSMWLSQQRAGSQCGYPTRGLEVNVDIPTDGWKSMWLSHQRAGSQCGIPNRMEVNVAIPPEGWKSMCLSQQRAGNKCGLYQHFWRRSVHSCISWQTTDCLRHDQPAFPPCKNSAKHTNSFILRITWSNLVSNYQSMRLRHWPDFTKS